MGPIETGRVWAGINRGGRADQGLVFRRGGFLAAEVLGNGGFGEAGFLGDLAQDGGFWLLAGFNSTGGDLDSGVGVAEEQQMWAGGLLANNEGGDFLDHFLQTKTTWPLVIATSWPGVRGKTALGVPAAAQTSL